MLALGSKARSDVFVCALNSSAVCKAKTARAGPKAFYVSKTLLPGLLLYTHFQGRSRAAVAFSGVAPRFQPYPHKYIPINCYNFYYS